MSGLMTASTITLESDKNQQGFHDTQASTQSLSASAGQLSAGTTQKVASAVTSTKVDDVDAPKISVQELQEQLKQKQEELDKREAALDKKQKALEMRQELLDKKDMALEVRDKNLDREMKKLSAMQRQMDARLEEPDWSTLRQKITAKEKVANQRYDEKQRKKMLNLFDKHLKNARKLYEKLEKKSSIAGMKGLKRTEEISLRRQIIEEKSGAMQQYISLTAENSEEEKNDILREEANKWARLRNMYVAFGDHDGMEKATRTVDALRGSLLQADLDKMEKAGMKPGADIDVDDEEEVKEKKSETRTETEVKDEEQIVAEVKTGMELVTVKVDDKVKTKEELEEGLEKNNLGWLKNVNEQQRRLIILYGKFDYTRRIVWINEQLFKEKNRFAVEFRKTEEYKNTEKDRKDELLQTKVFDHMKEFKAGNPELGGPSKEELEACLQTVLDAWKESHKDQFEQLNGPQKALWEKKMIPELDESNDPLGKLMRECVNNLHGSMYIQVTHKAREVDEKEKFSHKLKPAKTATAKDPFKGYEYEVQDRANDCWSVALTGLLNFNRTPGKKYEQKAVRKYKPVFREQGPDEKPEDYKKAKEEIERFTTENQDDRRSFMGNVFALSDYIAQELGDVAVRHMVFNGPKCKLDDERNAGKNAMHNVTQVLKQTIRDVVSSGQPIAVLTGKHYRMIVDANQDGVIMANSAGSGSLTQRYTYDELMSEHDTLELTWVQKDKLKDLPEEFKGLKIDGDEFSSEANEILEDPDLVAITQGVVVHKKATEMDPDVSEYISERVYVPKQLNKKKGPVPEPKKDEKEEKEKKEHKEKETKTDIEENDDSVDSEVDEEEKKKKEEKEKKKQTKSTVNETGDQTGGTSDKPQKPGAGTDEEK